MRRIDERSTRVILERNDPSHETVFDPPIDRSPTIANPSSWGLVPWSTIVVMLILALIKAVTLPRPSAQPSLSPLDQIGPKGSIVIQEGDRVRRITVDELRAELDEEKAAEKLR